MIGLSASFCICDIVEGKVLLGSVKKIVTGLEAPTPEILEEVVRSYRQSYWIEYPDKAERVFRHLLAEGKIEQPRVTQGRGPCLANRVHWVYAEDEIEWREA